MSTDEQIAFYQVRRPSCLKSVGAAPTNAPPLEFDGHGEPVNTFFSLTCRKCGGEGHTVIGHNHHAAWGGKRIVVLVSPIRLRCVSCAADDLLFDTDRDGYDAALNGKGTHYRAVGSEVAFTCTCGKGREFSELTARFEYSGDVIHAPEEYEGKPLEDLFTWFTLTGKCTHCANISQIADFECA